jgi:hypothetical protein
MILRSMDKKRKSLLLAGLVFGISFCGIGMYFLTNNHVVNITVLWDNSPEGPYYQSSDPEPESVSLISILSSRDYPLEYFESKLEKNISLVQSEPGIYTAQTEINLQAFRKYYVVMFYPEFASSNLIFSNTSLISRAHNPNNVTLDVWSDLYNNPVVIAFKPVIYLYNTDQIPFTESLSVTMPTGYAFETIPEIELGTQITWENLNVYPDSQISYEGEWYPYLFYEVALQRLDTQEFNHGWVIQNFNNTILVNGVQIGGFDKNDCLSGFFAEQLNELGLYEQEITDFTDYWLEEQHIFNEEGTYILHQIPLDVVNELFQLETTHLYSTTRVFFTFSYSSVVETNLNLISPVSVTTKVNSDYILHEWGIIF